MKIYKCVFLCMLIVLPSHYFSRGEAAPCPSFSTHNSRFFDEISTKWGQDAVWPGSFLYVSEIPFASHLELLHLIDNVFSSDDVIRDRQIAHSIIHGLTHRHYSAEERTKLWTEVNHLKDAWKRLCLQQDREYWEIDALFSIIEDLDNVLPIVEEKVCLQDVLDTYYADDSNRYAIAFRLRGFHPRLIKNLEPLVGLLKRNATPTEHLLAYEKPMPLRKDWNELNAWWAQAFDCLHDGIFAVFFANDSPQFWIVYFDYTLWIQRCGNADDSNWLFSFGPNSPREIIDVLQHAVCFEPMETAPLLEDGLSK